MSVGWAESSREEADDNSSGDTEGWVTYALNGNYYSNGSAGSLLCLLIQLEMFSRFE